MTLYLVKGLDALGFCVCAGHYIADVPKLAIALFDADQRANPHTDLQAYNALRLVASRSKAKPESMALNHPSSPWRTCA
ncbi:MAG TPA: hypothetical protein VF499_02965 [Afipia sp.]